MNRFDHLDELCSWCMRPRTGPSGMCAFCPPTPPTQDQHHMKMPTGVLIADQYVVGRVLGKGGFGITYLGADINLGNRVAIKEYFPTDLAVRAEDRLTVQVMSPTCRDTYDYGLEQFASEARRLAKYQRVREIVTVINYVRENNTGYLVMEYLEGRTLGEYLATTGGALTPPVALRLLAGVLNGLEAMHAEQMLHRDISPDNIFMTDAGDVKLIDLGAARLAVGGRTQNLSVILKHGYAPPEQYHQNGHQGPWTDIYAFGITLYRCITGQNAPDALDRRESDRLDWSLLSRSGTDRGLVRALQKATSIDPKQRYQSIRELRSALYRNPTPTEEPVPGPTVLAEPARRTTKFPWIAVAACCVLAIALAVVSVTAYSARRDQQTKEKESADRIAALTAANADLRWVAECGVKDTHYYRENLLGKTWWDLGAPLQLAKFLVSPTAPVEDTHTGTSLSDSLRVRVGGRRSPGFGHLSGAWDLLFLRLAQHSNDRGAALDSFVVPVEFGNVTNEFDRTFGPYPAKPGRWSVTLRFTPAHGGPLMYVDQAAAAVERR